MSSQTDHFESEFETLTIDGIDYCPGHMDERMIDGRCSGCGLDDPPICADEDPDSPGVRCGRDRGHEGACGWANRKASHAA